MDRLDQKNQSRVATTIQSSFNKKISILQAMNDKVYPRPLYFTTAHLNFLNSTSSFKYKIIKKANVI